MGKNRDFSKFPNAITVLDNGNVGINTTTFSEGTQPAGTLSFIPNSSVSSGPLIQLAGNGRIRPASSGDRLSIDGNALYFNSYIGGNILMNSAGGNVGIGTNSPAKKLTIDGTDALITELVQLRNSNLSWSGEALIKAFSDVDSSSIPATAFGYFRGTSSTGDGGSGFIIKTGTRDSLSTKLIVNQSGNVGIGITSPSHKLSVVDSGYNQYSLRLESQSGNTANRWGGIGFAGEGSNTKAGIFFVSEGSAYSRGSLVFANNSDFNQNNATPSDERMRINKDGQITKPYQPCFSAYGPESGASTRTTGAFTSFNLTRINRGSHYNTSTGRFTAPVAGAYEFIFSLLWRQSSDSGPGEISLAINGANVSSRGMAYTYAGAANDFHDQTFVRAIFNLSAGDYVTGWIHSSGNGTGNWYYGQQLAHFSGYLLG